MTTGALPWFKAWPQRWLNATRELTLEERGAYNDLLQMLYLRDRRIPDDAQFVANFLGVSKRRWNAIREVLLDHDRLVLIGDYLTDERFERERAATRAKREEQAAKGRKGGKARAEQAARDRQGQFALNEDEKRGNPPTQSRQRSGKTPDIHENGETEHKTQQNQRSAPDSGLDDLDDSFLAENDSSRDFRGVFDDFSRDFRGSKNSENGGNPPASSRPVRARERVKEVRGRDSTVESPTSDGGSGGKGTRRGTRLPDSLDFRALSNGTAERVAVWPPGKLEDEWERFRDWCSSNGTTSKDWEARWRNWIRKADDDWKRDQRRGGSGRQGWSGVADRVMGQG